MYINRATEHKQSIVCDIKDLIGLPTQPFAVDLYFFITWSYTVGAKSTAHLYYNRVHCMTCSDGYICHRGLAYEMAELADDFSQNSFFITPPKK